MLLFLTLLQIVFVGGEESLFWYSKDVNLIAPNYLPEARKENRRLAVVIDGDSKYVKLTCIMSGFEGNKTSKAKWSTDFEDPQISKSDSGPTWIDNDNGYAGWEVNINVSHKDSGDKKISCNYQQGYFAKVIEVEFNIYTIKEIRANDLKYNSRKRDCDGLVDVVFNQKNTDSIPYADIISDVKSQIRKLNNIYKPNHVLIKESKNIYTVKYLHLKDARKLQNNLSDKKWTQNGHLVGNIYNPDNLCLCKSTRSTSYNSWCFTVCNHKPWYCPESECDRESCLPKRIPRCKGPSCRSEKIELQPFRSKIWPSEKEHSSFTLGKVP